MSANKVSRKYGLWIVLVSLLVAGMMAAPDLWAAPGRNPRRQTVPPGTLTPTPDSSAPTDEPTSKPTKKPSPSNPTQAPDDTPTFTPVPIRTAVPTSTPIPVTTTAEAFTVTPSASPTVAEVASPTAVPSFTAAVSPASPTDEVAASSATPAPEEPVVVEDTLASAGVQPAVTASTQPEESHVPAPALASPTQVEPSSDVDTGGVSPLFCGGIGMVVMGMVLLAAWRLRA
jgi:hypothetical protein